MTITSEPRVTASPTSPAGAGGLSRGDDRHNFPETVVSAPVGDHNFPEVVTIAPGERWTKVGGRPGQGRMWSTNPPSTRSAPPVVAEA
jgi:hypothetical protein